MAAARLPSTIDLTGSPKSDIFNDSTTESRLLVLLRESQREAEVLRRELEVVQNQADADQALLEQLVYSSNPVHPVAVVAEMCALQERLARADAETQEAKEQTRFVEDNWAHVDRYLSTIECQARDARAAFSQILAGDDSTLLLPHESHPTMPTEMPLRDYLSVSSAASGGRPSCFPPPSDKRHHHSLPPITPLRVPPRSVQLRGVRRQTKSPQSGRIEEVPRTYSLLEIDLRSQPPARSNSRSSAQFSSNIPIRNRNERKAHHQHLPPIELVPPERETSCRAGSSLTHDFPLPPLQIIQHNHPPPPPPPLLLPSRSPPPPVTSTSEQKHQYHHRFPVAGGAANTLADRRRLMRPGAYETVVFALDPETSNSHGSYNK
ncbi:hypothetical protein C8J57DRAFT_1475822 [Mycena rebaudengoi]|nr:hypothetical protein C8J57DRAFT_1475822 [Mycena rebaudengoi]